MYLKKSFQEYFQEMDYVYSKLLKMGIKTNEYLQVNIFILRFKTKIITHGVKINYVKSKKKKTE